MKEDLHIHSIVSDGEMTPEQIIYGAKDLGLKKISITDHDALGAYVNFKKDPFKVAKKKGLELLSGIELDCLYSGKELHLLGYGVEIENYQLNSYLKEIKTLRKKRVVELIEGINSKLKKNIFKDENIFYPWRDTYMKPHVIKPLLKNAGFKEYQDAAYWLSQNVKVQTKIPKPHIQKMINLVLAAGGKPVIAHPGYIVLENNISLEILMRDLKDYGIWGAEYFYPYKFNKKMKKENLINIFKKELKEICHRFKLHTTRGSDAHTLREFREYNNKQ